MDARDALRAKLLKKAKEQINEKLAGAEIHIIKAVRLLSDLESVSNLLGENASEWKKRSPSGEAEKEFALLEENSSKIEEEKKSLTEFIEKEMNLEFQHFALLATPVLGAKLLASAGSKKRLCFMPSSTIQLLGAEKALFAHMRHKAKSPKHGHIFNHPLMQKLPRSKRGRAARIIAGKLSIALKIDYFNGKEDAQKMLEELNSEIAKIENEPIDERKEKEYKEREERQKKEYNKSNGGYFSKEKPQENQNKPKTESRTWTPEERRAYFEKMGMRKPEHEFKQKQNYPQRQDKTPKYQEEYPQKNNYGKKPYQKNFDRQKPFGEKNGQEKSDWRKKPNYEHTPREKNWGERPQRERRFSNSNSSRENWHEQRSEHSYRPNRSERSFGGERKYGERNDQNFNNNNENQNSRKNWQNHSFHKPHNTKKYAKRRFGNKFGKKSL